MKKAPPLDVGLRDELQAFFRDDILTMQDMLGRDLSIWLNNDSQSASH
jgi:hypothetical protein